MCPFPPCMLLAGSEEAYVEDLWHETGVRGY